MTNFSASAKVFSNSFQLTTCVPYYLICNFLDEVVVFISIRSEWNNPDQLNLLNYDFDNLYIISIVSIKNFTFPILPKKSIKKLKENLISHDEIDINNIHPIDFSGVSNFLN